LAGAESFDALGFTTPFEAEPVSGELATRAFFVVFRELIRDFFWIVIVLLLVSFLLFCY
jgi:hypothetical protein